MSRSGIRQKHAADAMQLSRISHPASHPYKEGPHVRGNGASTQDAPEDKIRIKEYTIQQKIRPRGCQVGSADPLGGPNLAWFPSRCTLRRNGY